VSSITIVSDAPNCGITCDPHYDDHFIIQATGLILLMMLEDLIFNNDFLLLILNWREPKSCIGRVFNSKLGCIGILHDHDKGMAYKRPLLELKLDPGPKVTKYRGKLLQ
jgi:hypothetical protein